MKDFREMTISELVAELDRFRNQILKQGYKMTYKQHARWSALSREYRLKCEDLAR